MSQKDARLSRCEFVLDTDPSLWMEEHNDCDPVVIPRWPSDYPAHLAVFLTAAGEVGVALTQRSMLAARDAARLWFCRISLDDFLAATDAEPHWFKTEDSE